MKKCCLCLLSVWTMLTLLSLLWYNLSSVNFSKQVNFIVSTESDLAPSTSLSGSKHLINTTAEVQKEKGILVQFCNLPTHQTNTLNLEGDINDGYSLVGVIVIFRHGDRGPLTKLKSTSKVNCTIYTSDLYRNFETAVKAYGSKAVIDRTLPNSDFCHPGLLSKQGSSQLLELGLSLKNCYGKHLNFSNSLMADSINALTTSYSRTIQSMYSFLFGFLGPANFLRVKLQSRNQVSFCFKHCRCPVTDHLEKKHKKDVSEKLYRDTYIVDSFTTQVLLFHKLMEKPSKIELPSTIKDIALFYICHNLSLPLIGTSSLSSANLEVIHEALKREANASASGLNLKKAAVLRTYGLFLYINQKIESWIFSSRTGLLNHEAHKNIIFISGHDLTLMYILVALGIYDGFLPLYASRITLEVLKFESQYFLRILLNGKDVTKNVCPYETSVYCSAKFLLPLVQSSLKMYYGTTDFMESCNS